MKLTELAAALGVEPQNLREDFEIRAVTTLERAGAGDVSFIASDKYAREAAHSAASAFIVPAKLPEALRAALPSHAAVLALAEPWSGVLLLLQTLHPEAGRPDFSGGGVHPTAVVDPTAQVAADASIGPNAVIGPRAVIGARAAVGANSVVGRDCRVGEGCIIHPAAVLQDSTVLGRDVIVQPGAVLGADGFKYEIIGGRWTKIPQVGNVVVEDGAEIGANSCVDRASYTETRIRANTKIDNLVQIAHNVKVGAGCIIVSQSGIAGSTELGDGSILAAQAGIADNLKVGKRCVILARAAVKDHLKDGETVLGAPARPFRQAARIMAAEAKLPDWTKELERMRQRLDELEKRFATADGPTQAG